MSFDHGVLHLANWLCNAIMPLLAAVLALGAAYLNSANQKTLLRLVAAMLTASLVWKLVTSMV
jgi:hypothetical protein